ncbi:putative transcriptional regulatory protein C1F7.11c [Mycena kentingensis (nom. inval.)]|nr:putative transcriptional regulatory protein C1F7.11c [Mycena kentingensis (nom. inval.)]
MASLLSLTTMFARASIAGASRLLRRPKLAVIHTNTRSATSSRTITALKDLPHVADLELTAGQASTERRKVFVGNLPYGVTEQDLRATMERYGPVDRIILMRDRDQNMLPWCFVLYKNPAHAERAQQLEEKGMPMLQGRNLRLSAPASVPQRPKPGAKRSEVPSRTVYISGIPFGVSEVDVNKMLTRLDEQRKVVDVRISWRPSEDSESDKDSDGVHGVAAVVYATTWGTAQALKTPPATLWDKPVKFESFEDYHRSRVKRFVEHL